MLTIKNQVSGSSSSLSESSSAKTIVVVNFSSPLKSPLVEECGGGCDGDGDGDGGGGGGDRTFIMV